MSPEKMMFFFIVCEFEHDLMKYAKCSIECRKCYWNSLHHIFFTCNFECIYSAHRWPRFSLVVEQFKVETCMRWAAKILFGILPMKFDFSVLI